MVAHRHRPQATSPSSGTSRKFFVALVMLSASCLDYVPREPDEASPVVARAGAATLRLGGTTGNENTDFHNVVGAFVDRRAEILVIANGGDGTIRMFGLHGEWQSTRGRIGEGPAEFTSLEAIFDYRGDSLLAFDGGTGYAAVWPYSSGRVRRVSVRDLPEDLGFVNLRGSLPDGRLLWMAPKIDRRFDPPGQSHHQEMIVFLTSPAGEGFDLIGETTAAIHYRYRSSRFAVGRAPFSSRAFAVVHDSVVFFGSTWRPRALRWSAAGAAREFVTFDLPVKAVSNAHRLEDLAARRSRLQASPPTPLRTGRLEALDQLPYPDSFPAIGGVVAGSGGRVWVTAYQPSASASGGATAELARWSAYSGPGSQGDHILFPPGFELLWVDDVEAVGVVRDELDVEQVLVVPFSWPGKCRRFALKGS